MFKRLSALYSVGVATEHLEEEIAELKWMEKSQCYIGLFRRNFKLSNGFEEELTRLKLNEHKKVLRMRELMKEYRELETRLLEAKREAEEEAERKGELIIIDRVKSVEDELKAIKALLNTEEERGAIKCPYCSYEYELEEWDLGEFGLIHECANCENEYLITKTEVRKYQ